MQLARVLSPQSAPQVLAQFSSKREGLQELRDLPRLTARAERLERKAAAAPRSRRSLQEVHAQLGADEVPQLANAERRYRSQHRRRHWR
eukprot:CAMPEP_0171143180 /NCGR_PEP_ID=MMETSP0766_2-20121228/143869_1 /TAXON_ID=439317 /ORGANISM="Gambierdiscus australes, Strain CAWD 149" /LENGTH=88 /DNA_ID=CAMNT_0011606999 /DNA_START=245 /DNA_END=510 /DNA_ORIENTATION=-